MSAGDRSIIARWILRRRRACARFSRVINGSNLWVMRCSKGSLPGEYDDGLMCDMNRWMMMIRGSWTDHKGIDAILMRGSLIRCVPQSLFRITAQVKQHPAEENYPEHHHILGVQQKRIVVVNIACFVDLGIGILNHFVMACFAIKIDMYLELDEQRTPIDLLLVVRLVFVFSYCYEHFPQFSPSSLTILRQFCVCQSTLSRLALYHYLPSLLLYQPVCLSLQKKIEEQQEEFDRKLHRTRSVNNPLSFAPFASSSAALLSSSSSTLIPSDYQQSQSWKYLFGWTAQQQQRQGHHSPQQPEACEEDGDNENEDIEGSGKAITTSIPLSSSSLSPSSSSPLPHPPLLNFLLPWPH